MSKYTTELRYLIESLGESEIKSLFTSYNLSEYLNADELEVVNNSRFDKNKLADKILKHYYFREIGFETYGVFKHYALSMMNEIMEKYLPLIYSAMIEYNPLVNVDYTETYESSGTETSGRNSVTNGTTSDEMTNIKNDTPNSSLSDIKTGKYASQVDYGNSSIINNGSETENRNAIKGEEYERHYLGNSGSLSTSQKLIEQYRENIKAYETEIINELDILFMQIY